MPGGKPGFLLAYCGCRIYIYDRNRLKTMVKTHIKYKKAEKRGSLAWFWNI